MDKRLKILNRNGERIIIASFYGKNRSSDYVEYHQRVFSHLDIPINYVLADFPRCTHGAAIDAFLASIGDVYDYFVLFDTDAVPLRRDFIEIAYDKIRDKRTVFGAAQQSNHISVNGSTNHIYAGPCAFAISRAMYIALGRPTFSETCRSDCAEEITWHAEERGFNVCVIYPSKVIEQRWELGNGHYFGVGTTYGDCIFHSFVQSDDRSRALFVETCKDLLAREPSSAERKG